METKVTKIEFIRTELKTFVYLTLEDKVMYINAQTWEQGTRNLLKLSLSQLLHLLNEGTTDLMLDVQFALDVNTEHFEDVLKDILTGANVRIEQSLREAGTEYIGADGNVAICSYDNIATDGFVITHLTPLGRYAIDAEEWRANDSKRKAAWKMTKRAAVKTAATKVADDATKDAEETAEETAEE